MEEAIEPDPLPDVEPPLAAVEPLEVEPPAAEEPEPPPALDPGVDPALPVEPEDADASVPVTST